MQYNKKILQPAAVCATSLSEIVKETTFFGKSVFSKHTSWGHFSEKKHAGSFSVLPSPVVGPKRVSSAWTMEVPSMKAVRNDNGSSVSLRVGNGIPYEGWLWDKPRMPQQDVAVMACCLLDKRFRVTLHPLHSKHPGTQLCVASRSDRLKLLQHLKSHRTVERCAIAVEPSAYHHEMIGWFGRVMSAIKPTQMFFVLPVLEYHGYIRDLEHAAGQTYDSLHQSLDEHACLVESLVKKHCGDSVQILQPTKCLALDNDIEAFLSPFMHAEKMLGVPLNRLCAFLDAREAKMLFEVERRTGVRVPMLAGFLKHPWPSGPAEAV